MRQLLKLPVYLVILCALVMAGVNALHLGFFIIFKYQYAISAIVFLTGLGLILSGGYVFRKSKTTFDPVNPELASKLVTEGIYRFSRNPMYVGFLLWLLSLVILSGNPVNLLLLPVFVVLANKLYIAPEENVLERKFGKNYLTYKKRVRRWI